MEHRIEVSLSSLNQLFNSLDPSPFHKKDLDHDAEEFIVSWAQEFPAAGPLILVLHLERAPHGAAAQVQEAVRNYFAYRAELNRRELRRLLRQGRVSLMIGCGVLALCAWAASLSPLIREGVTIAGWVAMWKPMQIYLYDWWPLARLGRVYRSLASVTVELAR